MFGYWKQRRKLQRQIAELDKKFLPDVEKARSVYTHATPGEGLSALVGSDYHSMRKAAEMELEILDAKHLLAKAEKWGLDRLPAKEMYDPHVEGVEMRPYFKPQNKALMRKMIADARFNTIKRWVELLSPIVSTVIALIALIVSIIAIYQT